MEPWPSSCERTAWSMSRLDIEACEMRLAVRTGLPTTEVGKSHSCVTPTKESSRPSAQTISVADGSSETMRGAVLVIRVPFPSGRFETGTRFAQGHGGCQEVPRLLNRRRAGGTIRLSDSEFHGRR